MLRQLISMYGLTVLSSTHAEKPEALYPIEFQMAANAIIARDFNIVQENIKIDNVKMIYLNITKFMNAGLIIDQH